MNGERAKRLKELTKGIDDPELKKLLYKRLKKEFKKS